MSRERLKIKVSGVVYDSKDIARKTGVGLNQARYRMNQYQKGHKTKAQLFAPAQKKKQIALRKQNAFEQMTIEQKQTLAEFDRLTLKDERLIEKYYSDL